MREKSGRPACVRSWIALGLLLTVSGAALAAPNNQKKKKNAPPTTPDTSSSILTPPITQQIDQAIGEMLGAFQLGDIETMHKHYADNATFVSGVYSPPIVG